MISEEQPMFFYLALKMNNLLEKIFHPIVRNLNTCASVAVLKIIISNQVHTRPNSNCVIYENAVGTCLFAYFHVKILMPF